MTGQSTPRITVVVLTYNSGKFITECLTALQHSRGVELEVICVDNASTDDSHNLSTTHPSAPKAIRLERNLGYSGGNNAGWVLGTMPIVVFINPDCRVMQDTLARLVNPFAQDERIAVTGALLYYPNSTIIQHAGGILHPNGMCEHFGMNKPDAPEFHESKDVEYVTGALIAFRRSDLERFGGFDEEFWPAYYEETDLCWRLRKEGKRVRYVAEAIAYHYESPGLEKNSTRFVRTSYRSRIRFVVKNFSLGEFLGDFLPFEWRWFFGPFARGYRFPALRSYGSGLLFALFCSARFSRRRRT
ncbi:glycosyltransferase family 2 protein [Candidatus Sumerlaeota bacterium]|nr:glycosyltransferase family 2 protein [Candidatus Sumerlaeota bacterium]